MNCTVRSVLETDPHFRQRPMSDIVRRCAAWLTDMKKSRLNWKLKISITADNADITQSQTSDTRHRRMQEVNSLCTDCGPLPAEYCIVGIPHITAV